MLVKEFSRTLKSNKRVKSKIFPLLLLFFLCTHDMQNDFWTQSYRIESEAVDLASYQPLDLVLTPKKVV